MCIIKLGKELINTEAFNESAEEKNYNYILNNCFDESISIEKRKSLMPAIIPKIDIEFFLANSTISSIKVLPLSKGRELDNFLSFVIIKATDKMCFKLDVNIVESGINPIEGICSCTENIFCANLALAILHKCSAHKTSLNKL